MSNDAAMAILLLALSAYGSDADPDEAFCLAQNVWFEAASSSRLDRRAVAHVTMNRVRDSRRWPDTVCEVVHQPGQFSWTEDGRSDEVLVVVREDYVLAWAEAVDAAMLALEGLDADPTDGATHYHATWADPYWSAHMTPLLLTVGHEYYDTRARP